MIRSLRLSVVLGSAAAALWLSGCATLPDEAPHRYTTAIPAQGPETPLDRISHASMEAADAGFSGFRLVLGPSGLDARLALMRGAQRSLDLQYYHLHDDVTGRLVLRELRNAAIRGVRVRLLLDDLYTDGLEDLLRGLGTYPNVEVRLFNPFPVRGSMTRRFASSLLDFGRLHRRMHNKMFIADSVLGLAGGRNLGDEYFLRGSQSNFFDYDVLVAGPAIAQMMSLFDEYWNAREVRTADSVLGSLNSADLARHSFDARVSDPETPDPVQFRGLDRLGRPPVTKELEAGRVNMVFGSAYAFADSPAKASGEFETGRLPSGARLENNRHVLHHELLKARLEVLIASPYLVPSEQALKAAQLKVAQGARISLLTNSLAATDEPVVHTGYRRHRDNMLRAGIEIFELHPDLGQRLLRPGEITSTPLRLHSKVTVIDRECVVIGSANFDPRSESLNTEFGLFICSPELAAQASDLLKLLQQEASYEVRLKNGAHRLEWVRRDEQQREEITDHEPGADFWTRIKLYIQSVLVPESLL